MCSLCAGGFVDATDSTRTVSADFSSQAGDFKVDSGTNFRFN